MKWSWRKALGLEKKDILPWRAGSVISTEDGDNFVRNQVTVAAAMDGLKSGGAVGLSATFACTNLLAGTIASLPLMIYRDVNGVRKVAKDHQLYWILHDSPNYDQSAYDFWEYIVAGLELAGNGYARIIKRDDGSIFALEPIRPDTVRPKRLESGAIEYRWTKDGRENVARQDEILHIRGPLGDALGGVSTLSTCRSVFASAEYADQAAGSTFSNGVRASGVLSTDSTITLTGDQRTELENHLKMRYAGAMKEGQPLLLDRGMKWQQLSLSPEDAQLLETRRFGVEEICRIFGVPPHMIGHTEGSTSWGTGLEQQTLGFVKFSLRRRLKRIEQALEKQLLSASDRRNGVTIEFNLEGLLRGDSESRAKFYESGLRNGWRTINEVRALENLPPVPGGDEPRMQMQNVPITGEGGANGA